MKRLLITGCNGQLGRAINEMYKDRTDIELINTDIFEGDGIRSMDISDIDSVIKLVSEVKPYAIINCAAHTNVDGCEKDVDGAYKINAIGPRNLSIAATETKSKMFHISTDYVFAGDAVKPYTEFDTPNPKSMYGSTKLAGENFVKEFSDRHFIVRTAWLYGDGKNFVRTMLRLSENNDVVNVVSDQVGSPTSTKVLADIIDKLVFTDNYGTFHGTCEGVCSWAEFTEEIFRLKGIATKVKKITSEEYGAMYPAAAKRPAYSVLDNYMLRLTTGYMVQNWREAIKKYLGE